MREKTFTYFGANVQMLGFLSYVCCARSPVERVGKEKKEALEPWVILGWRSLAEKEEPEKKFEKEQSGRQQEISVVKKSI